MPPSDEYKVEGYGVKSEYDSPYLDGHDFDPKEKFQYAGDVKSSQLKHEAEQLADEPDVEVEVEDDEKVKVDPDEAKSVRFE